MTLGDACQKASQLNRAQEASGSRTRYVVVANPIGSWDGDHQIVRRTVRMSRSAATR